MLEDVGQVVLWVFIIGITVAGCGFALAYLGFLSALPFVGAVSITRWFRRTRKILKDTRDDYDRDGFRKHRVISGYGRADHYYRGAGGIPVLPLETDERLIYGRICVTVSRSGNAVYVDRAGRALKKTPRGLRGVDPQEWLEDRQRACELNVRDYIDEHAAWYIRRDQQRAAAAS